MSESTIDVTYSTSIVGLPEPEFVENPSTRCPVCLLLDTSGSMSGKPIEELFQGLKILEETLKEDDIARYTVEVSIVTFDSSVQVVQDFVTINEFQAPNLSASGTTHMGSAINKGLDLIEQRKQQYKDNGVPYYRPWLFLITDGAPTDSWKSAAKRVRQAESDRKLSFFTIGVQGAKMKTLKQIAPVNRPPMMLKGLNFQDLFLWLSNSVAQVSHSKPGDQLALPPTDGWGSISV